MPKIMKPPTDYDENDTDTGGNFYDGPLPVDGLYKGKIVKLFLTKTVRGENKGQENIMVVCEITEGKYKGAGVAKFLQLTKQGSSWVNQFLHSLTDGSEEQKKAIRHAFKNIGYEVGEKDSKNRFPIVKIGKKTNPIGLTTSFVTKKRTGTDEVERAEISRFVVPLVDNDEDAEDSTPEDALDSTEDGDYEESGMDEFASDGESSEEDADSDSTDSEDPWEV